MQGSAVAAYGARPAPVRRLTTMVTERSEHVFASGCWSLQRRVLPQHTDHAGVMWHGAYLGWLEEARVEALAQAGLAYSDLSARGLELPVVSLAIDYRQALRHGDLVRLESQVLPRRGVRLPWRTRFVTRLLSAPDAAADLTRG